MLTHKSDSIYLGRSSFLHRWFRRLPVRPPASTWSSSSAIRTSRQWFYRKPGPVHALFRRSVGSGTGGNSGARPTRVLQRASISPQVNPARQLTILTEPAFPRCMWLASCSPCVRSDGTDPDPRQLGSVISGDGLRGSYTVQDVTGTVSGNLYYIHP